jgi:hypothetical protein
MKIAELDKFQRELDEARKVPASFDGNIASLQFDPEPGERLAYRKHEAYRECA